MVKFVHTTSCATLFTETFPIFAHFAILNRKLLTTLICIVMRGVLAADLTYTVPEDVSPNHLIANLARDTNLQQFISADSLHDLRYSFLAGDPDQTRMFRLSETTSDLKTAQNTTSFDRETLCLYSEKCVLHVQVAVHSILNQFFRKISVNINVTDVNDNAPVFPTESLEVRISETISIPSSFPLVTATDLDTGPGNGLKEYELVPVDGPFGLHYSVGNPNLILVVERAGIDHEKQKSYQVKVLARDGGNPVNTGTLSVNILIEDKNDNEPHFSEQTYEVTVDEHAARGERLIAVKATDVDSGQNGMLRYKLSDQQSVDVLNMFKIDLLSGELSIIGDLENGKREKYKIIVEATDMGSPPFTTTTAVTVRVRDTINSLPKITISFLVGGNGYSRISEYASVGAVVVHVAVVDADRGRNGIIQCHIEQRQYYKLQSLDVNEYKVIVARTLDRETIAIHNVTVLCSDAGIKPLTASSTFEVRVLDENDNSPRFSEQSYRVFLPENRLAGHELLRVTASDEDSGENGKVRYSLHRNARGRFLISASTGEIVTNDEFNYELQTSFNFTVIAIDGGIPALTGSTEIVVIIIDVNDQRPSFARDIFSFTVSEFARLGKVVGRVTANDFESGPNGQLDIFADRNANVGPFAVQSNGSITLNGLLDHELTKYYYFRVIARDHGRSPLSDTTEVQITVLDENDNRPIVTNPNGTELIIRVSMDNDVAVPVAVMKATDKDSGLNGQVQYVITSRNDSGRFDVDSKSGEMFITRTLSHRDVTTYRIQVLVQDSGTPPLSASRPITLWIHAGNSTRYAGNPGPTDTYFFLILVIICVTIILCAITVLIIVAMRRMDDRRKRHRPGSSAMHVQNSHALTSRTDDSKADNLRNQCLSDRLEEKEYGQRNFQTFGKGRYDEEEFGFSPFSKVDHAKQYGNVYSEATHHIPYSSEDRSTSASLPSSHAQQAPVVSKDETLDFRTRQPCLDRFWSCQESGYPVSSMLQPISRQEDGRSDCSVESLPSDSGRGGSDDDVSHCNGRSAVSSNDNRCLDSYHVPCQRGKPCLEHVRSYNGATVGSRENARNINQKHVTFKDTSFCNKNVKSCHSSKTTNIDDKVKPNMADPTTIETDNEADIEDTLSRQNGGHFDESIMKEAIVLEYSPTLMNNIPSYTKASDFFDKFEDDKRDTKLKTTGINFVMRTEIVTCENESFLSHSLNTAAATSDHGSPISLHSQPILSFVSQSSDSDVQTVSKTDRLINHNVACRPFSAVSPKQISSQPQHANNVSAFGKIETLHLSSRTNTGQPTDRMFNALNGEYGKCKMLHSSTGKGLEDRGLMMHNSSSDLLDNIPSYDDPLAIHSPQWTDIIV